MASDIMYYKGRFRATAVDFLPFTAASSAPACAVLDFDQVTGDGAAYASAVKYGEGEHFWTGGVLGARQQQKDEPAVRYDAGKPRPELIPADALAEVAKVYGFGAQKYSEDNWAKGMAWRRCYGALLRHALAWGGGEDADPESGVHHMAHVAWNALTLIAYAKRGVGADDRCKP